jgi:predicted Zn-dependent peptidase
MPNIKHGIYQGIKTTVIEDKQQIMSSASLWFARGYALDDANAQGLSHFFEHLWAGGDDEYIKAKTLEEYGINVNAYTTAYLTYYYHIQEPIHLITSLQLLLAHFDQKPVSREAFEKEKNIIAQEKKDSVQEISRVFAKNLYKGSSLAQDVYGDLDNISYEQYIQYAQLHYTKDRAHLVIITPNATEFVLEPANNEIYTLATDSLLSKINPSNTLIPTPDDNIEIMLGYGISGVFKERDGYHVSLLRTVLGNFWTSILIQELRVKKGLVYWVDVSNNYYSNTQSIGIHYKIEKKDLIESLGVIKTVLDNISSYIQEEDINRYKTILTSSAKIYYSDIYALTDFYGSLLAYSEGITYTPEAFYEQVRAISYEEVISLAKQFLSSHIKSLVIKGNLSEEEWVEAQKYI